MIFNRSLGVSPVHKQQYFMHTKETISPIWVSAFRAVFVRPLAGFKQKICVACIWSSCLLHLRHRYFLTRDNKLRLRYVASAFCLLAASMLFAVGATHQRTQNYALAEAPHLTLAKIEPSAGASVDVAIDPYPLAQTQKSLTNLLDSSRYGQFSLASAATHDVPKPKSEKVMIEAGDALGAVLQDRGVGAEDTTKAIKALSTHFNPRRIKAGQEVAMQFTPTMDGDYRFERMKIEMDPVKAVVVERAGDDFTAKLYEKKLEKVSYAKAADIEVSVFGSAAKANIPDAVTDNVIKIYSWDVDFQRDIQPGDRVEVMYDSFQTADGYVAKTGNIRYAKLIVGGVERPIYRYEMEDGRVDYFGPDGISIRRTLMKTPVEGARLSSGFGMRRHPVLGYNKMHKGLDFAAPTGTPIFAAGDGVVEKAGRFSSYGNYILIRHNGSLKTAYAHLHKFKSGLRAGMRVRQGEVIGYVGSTGRSTGPHLHYEVIHKGVQVNPRSVNLPTGEELTGAELKAFKEHVRAIDREYRKLSGDLEYAQKERPESERYN